jgi:hypothetical protein
LRFSLKLAEDAEREKKREKRLPPDFGASQNPAAFSSRRPGERERNSLFPYSEEVIPSSPL